MYITIVSLRNFPSLSISEAAMCNAGMPCGQIIGRNTKSLNSKPLSKITKLLYFCSEVAHFLFPYTVLLLPVITVPS
jgi:hypothetical protein